MGFARLIADGVRADHELLWVRFLPDPSLAAAQVAYSLPRQMGSAVIRNTIRRRLRDVVKDLDQQAPNGLPAGLYLIGTRRGTRGVSYADLRVSLAACLSKLDRTAS